MKRYDEYPSILVFGNSENADKEEEELFRTLIHRHSLNFYPPVMKTHIIQKGEDVTPEKITQMIQEMDL